jgi:predicted membrane-bound spermidine synthase
VVSSIDDAAHRLGRLYAVNTFGAALGAGISGWVLLGTFGFSTSIRLASGLSLLASLVALVLWRQATDEGTPAVVDSPVTTRAADSAWRWYVAYGLTGAIALGLEVVFLRLVDALMRSNAYTFAHVLTLYLVCFALGSALGSRWVKRSAHPGETFFLVQLGIGATALLGVAFLIWVPVPALREMFESYFATDGYLSSGPAMPQTARAAAKFAFVYLLGPLAVMGLPVTLMGVGYPFIQAEVSRALERLGRGTGRLMFANIVGNVLGTVLVGFFLLEALGSAGTLRLLAALSVTLGVLGFAWRFRRTWRLEPAPLAACLAGLVLVAASPSNERLWAFFHSAPLGDFSLVEERACVNAWVKKGDEQVLYLNATSQNGWPYDDFHVVIGIVPSVLHPNPRRALAVGLGAGSTAWGLLQDERLGSVECVELCGGEIELIRRLAQSHGSTESRQILEDPRSKLVVADGRRALLTAKEPFDVITVDAMRPNGASAGNVYSLEFYQLVREHLAEGGLFAQWIPTNRVLTTVKQVFPHVLSMEVPGGRGRFFIAANEPLGFDRHRLQSELERRSSVFSGGQRASLAQFAASVEPKVERAGGAPEPVAPHQLNTDLFPRDEYFLNSN